MYSDYTRSKNQILDISLVKKEGSHVVGFDR